MTKRVSLIIIVLSVFVSLSALFFYFSEMSQSKNTTPSTLLIPKTVPAHEEEVPELSLSNVSTSSAFSLLSVGDIMLDRSVMLKTQARGDYNHPFLLIDPLFKEYDLHLANLEGPITTFKSIANGTGGARFTFTFSPNFIDPLKNRFEFLSLANNHALNFGQAGLDQTRQFLKDAQVQYFGGPENTVGNIAVTSSYNGITFGLIGYHQLVETGFENILAEARKLDKEVDVLIAMPHWGVEYEQVNPSYLQKKEAHEMIDAGVDLIVGAHPHVIEPIEIYKDKVIFYSMGNFVFDQYFSEETMTGLAVGMKIEKGEGNVLINYQLIPLDINLQSQASVANSQKTKKVLDDLYKNSLVEPLVKEQIKTGVFQSQYQLPE